MNPINVNLKDRSYQIFTGVNIIHRLPHLLSSLNDVDQIAVVSTPPVSDLYLSFILDLLKDYKKLETFIVPDGENFKSLQMAEEIYTWLIQNNFERKSTVVTLGGGVIGDLAGYVAATYLRGVNLIHIPTTLLAQVDSSIGGKVGVNHALGKNLIGAFYQPRFVLADVNFLQTLDDTEFECGMGEVVKCALITDPNLFTLLAENFESINKNNTELTEKIVTICARHKADIVSQDETEQGKRAILNFGHTFAHALESLYEYKKLKHGQAVILGIKCAVYLSEKLGFLKTETANKINRLIDKFKIHLPSKLSAADVEKLIMTMKHDKKMEKSQLHFILIRDIGNVFRYVLSDNGLVAEAFNFLNSDRVVL